MKKTLSNSNIALIAIIGALSGLLMLIKFPIAIAPSFYKLDVSDLPALIGSLSLGPIPALFIQIIKIIVKCVLDPTKTGYVGELAAFLFSSVYCIIASIIYKLNRSKKGAYIAIIVSSMLMVIFACICNYYFLIEAYANAFNTTLPKIIELGQMIFPIINTKLDFVLCCVAPFNAIKAIICDVLTILLYKRISPILK